MGDTMSYFPKTVIKDANGNVINPATSDKQDLMRNDGIDILGSQNLPLSQRERAVDEDSVELLTYDTNVAKLLGNDILVNQGRVKVESANPISKQSFGSMRRALDEVIINLAGECTVAFQLVGTWAGTVSFYGSVDGVTWYAWSCKVTQAILSTAAISSTANGLWRADVVGLKAFKVAISAYTSGTAQCVMSASFNPISYQTQVTATINGGVGAQTTGGVLMQRNATFELTTSDSALREALYIVEPYNSNIVYYPGDVVLWRDRVYRCILQTVLTATVSSPASTTYWTVDNRPARSLVTTDYSSPPNSPRLRIEHDLDAYQYRIAETAMINQQIAMQNDMLYQDAALTVSQDYGGNYGKKFGVGQDSMTHYEFLELR
jgi:hypothetical protein